ncbi:hypothetical protein QBC35DRAFT_464412, partial [Podospora australis]
MAANRVLAAESPPRNSQHVLPTQPYSHQTLCEKTSTMLFFSLYILSISIWLWRKSFAAGLQDNPECLLVQFKVWGAPPDFNLLHLN